MRNAIADIIREVSEASDDVHRAEILRKNDHIALRWFLKMMLDDNIKWLLPEGEPPFTPNRYPDQEGAFYAEIRRLYLFMEGGNPNLSDRKREELFIQILEAVTPQDAKLLCQVKDHVRPNGITKDIVNAAFPGLI
jgi:hypothetical protein